MTAPYRVHRMIQDLQRDADRARAFAADPIPEFDRYGLLPEEREILLDGSRERLGRLGVHPSLQMKLRRLRRPHAPGQPPLEAAFLERLLAVQ